MKTFTLNIFIAIAGLSVLLVADYMYVNAEQNKELIKYSGWLNIIGLIIIPVGFYWVNFLALKNKTLFSRAATTTLITVTLSGLWFIAAFAIVGNFHLYIGGKL